MKKMNLILAMFLLLTSCNDDVQIKNPIYGKWKLIASRYSNGNGALPPWQETDPKREDEIIIFTENFTFQYTSVSSSIMSCGDNVKNGVFKIFKDDNSSNENYLGINCDNVISKNDFHREFGYSFSENDNILILSPIYCREGCRLKYERIN